MPPEALEPSHEIPAVAALLRHCQWMYPRILHEGSLPCTGDRHLCVLTMGSPAVLVVGAYDRSTNQEVFLAVMGRQKDDHRVVTLAPFLYDPTGRARGWTLYNEHRPHETDALMRIHHSHTWHHAADWSPTPTWDQARTWIEEWTQERRRRGGIVI